MNLPRNHEDSDILDLSLKHTLKNWVNRGKPPVDGKARLLNSAARIPQQTSHEKTSRLSILISMTLNESFIQIYLDSFKKTPYYSLQPGAMNMNYTNLMTAK
jgi:hypothetical protein